MCIFFEQLSIKRGILHKYFFPGIWKEMSPVLYIQENTEHRVFFIEFKNHENVQKMFVQNLAF